MSPEDGAAAAHTGSQPFCICSWGLHLMYMPQRKPVSEKWKTMSGLSHPAVVTM